MSQFFQRQPPRRAPRANLRGAVSAVIRLENGRQLPAKLRQLSITGGLLDLATYIEERSWVKLTIYFDSQMVAATAEMMFPMRGGLAYLQPFRFISLGGEELHVIDHEVTAFLKQSTTTKPTPAPSVRSPRFLLDSW